MDFKKIDEIRQERGKRYGDIKSSHENIGLIWQGILQNYFDKEIGEIPAHVVSLMLVAFKLARASKALGYQEDDYIDAFNYLSFASETDPQNKIK